MISIDIPGREHPLEIEALVLDYNGTIARDGALIEGIPERLIKLTDAVEVYVLTADTYGTVRGQCEPLGLRYGRFRMPAQACVKKRSSLS